LKKIAFLFKGLASKIQKIKSALSIEASIFYLSISAKPHAQQAYKALQVFT